MADLVRAHLRDQAPVPHDAHARAGLLGAKQIMRRHEHRDAPFPEPPEQLGELVRSLRIETRRRLVEEQRVGLLGDGDGDADLLAHALGVLRHPALHCVARQAGADEDVGQARRGQRFPPAQRGKVLQVLQAAEVAVQHHLLGDVGQAPLRLQGLGRDVEAGHVHAAGRRLDESQKQVDGGRLAGAVRAQQTVDLGWSDAEVEAGDGLHVAVALRQRPRFENGRQRHRRGRGRGIDRHGFAHEYRQGPRWITRDSSLQGKRKRRHAGGAPAQLRNRGSTDVDGSSGGRRPGAVPLDLRIAGMPRRRRPTGAGAGGLGVLVDARSDGRRALDVAQDARVVPRLGLVVEMRCRRESQQRERSHRSPLQRRRPTSPHACRFSAFPAGPSRARQRRSRACIIGHVGTR